MELEELGELLNKNIIPNNNAITYQSTVAPLSDYAKKIKFTLIAFPCAAILFALEFTGNAAARHSPTKWILVAALFSEFLVATFNYIIVKNLSNTDGNLKQNLLNKITLMQKAGSLSLYLNLFFYTSMAVALELSMKYKLDLNFAGWSSVNIVSRVLTYITFLGLQSFIRRASYKKYYGHYLEKVKQLAGQLE
jgi:hypothetical protein